jgi:tetratricopeptide (TPR) repeat protein
VDAANGNHLWADRFEKTMTDLFDMQDEIVARLANQLGTELISGEAPRAEERPDPGSMDLFFQGMSWYNRGPTSEHMTRARDFFERALAIEPSNVDALIGTAAVDTFLVGTYLVDNRSAVLISAEGNLAKALSLAPNHALAHAIIGWVQIYTNRVMQGIAECERALALDRNMAQAHSFIGLAKLIDGRPSETERHIIEALRLSPKDTRAFVWAQFVGTAKLHLGDDEGSIVWLRRSIEMNRNHPLAHFYFAAATALLVRQGDARSSLHEGLGLNPTFTLARFRAGASSDDPTYLAQRERVIEGMRKAGVPEG